MEPSALNSILLIQGSSAFLLFLVFRFLYVEGRERYFFACQIAWGFFAYGGKRSSPHLRMIGISLLAWAVLLMLGHSQISLLPVFIGYSKFLVFILLLLLALAMVMALYENERRRIRESLLDFSRLQLDHRRLMDASEIEEPIGEVLERVLRTMHTQQGVIWIAQDWRRGVAQRQDRPY